MTSRPFVDPIRAHRLSSEVKRPVREIELSLSSGTEVKSMWRCTFASPDPCMCLCFIDHKDKLHADVCLLVYLFICLCIPVFFGTSDISVTAHALVHLCVQQPSRNKIFNVVVHYSRCESRIFHSWADPAAMINLIDFKSCYKNHAV